MLRISHERDVLGIKLSIEQVEELRDGLSTFLRDTPDTSIEAPDNVTQLSGTSYAQAAFKPFIDRFNRKT